MDDTNINPDTERLYTLYRVLILNEKPANEDENDEPKTFDEFRAFIDRSKPASG